MKQNDSRSRGHRRQFRNAGIAAVSVAALALSACSSSTDSDAGVTGGNCTSTKEPVKISVIADLSGPSPALMSHGKAVVAAATTAAHLSDTSGGINCAPIQLMVHDGAGSSAGVTQAVRDAINDRPAAITGFAISGFLAGAVPLINQSKIPWMSTSPAFEGVADTPFFYSTQIANKVLGERAAEALKRELGGSLAGKRIAFEGTTNSATVDEVLAAMTTAVQAEGGSVGPVFRDSTVVTDWSSQAAKVTSENVDAVTSVGTDAGMIVMNQALKTANFGGKYLSILSATDAALSKVDSDSFLSMRNVNFPTEGSPLGDAVVAAGASLSDANASGYFGQEFAAASALIQTLRKCGNDCNADEFTKTVSGFGPYTIPLNALLGTMEFTPREATMPVGVFRWDASSGKTVQVGSDL